MGVELIAELATAHGGDVDLACDMVAAAADAGAHTVKIQSYSLDCLNRKDPQASWLRQAHLDWRAQDRVRLACERSGVLFLSTPFDVEALKLLRDYLGCWRFKKASSSDIADGERGAWIKSWPWGRKPHSESNEMDRHLTAIPLYPTPPEAVSVAPLLDGWSDHCVGIDACRLMITRGAKIIEAHFCLPGRSRQMSWDKTPEQFREIRDWADAVETMTTGVSTQFRTRWSA